MVMLHLNFLINLRIYFLVLDKYSLSCMHFDIYHHFGRHKSLRSGHIRLIYEPKVQEFK